MKLTLSAAEVSTLRDMHDDVRLRYSGRSMYGATCVGVVANDPILFAFDLARIVADRTADVEVSCDDMRDALTDGLSSPYRDSMGLSTIWYWTGVTVADDVADEDDEDEQ